MNREELSKLPVGTFKCYFKGEPALLEKIRSNIVYLKHDKGNYKGAGRTIEPFKYSWCIYAPYNNHVHEPLDLSEIIFSISNTPLGEL